MDKLSIRLIERKDAEQFLSLLGKLETQTRFMMLEPGEVSTSTAEQEKRIDSMDKHNLIYIALENTRIAGFCALNRNRFNRNKHCANTVLGVDEEYSGKGIGSHLLETVINYAKHNDIQRIELTVLEENHRAIHLYSKYGFVKEGLRIHSMKIDGVLKNELYMGLLL